MSIEVKIKKTTGEVTNIDAKEKETEKRSFTFKKDCDNQKELEEFERAVKNSESDF